MTPNDIATSVSGLKPMGEGSVNTSTNFTQSYSINGFITDDANTWD